VARRRFFKPVVERTSKGFVLHLDRDEIEVLTRLLGELRGLLGNDDPDVQPLLRRLFPPAYHLADNAEAEAEYQRFMREELVASRLAGIEQVETVLASGAPLDGIGLERFMQSLNSIRLVLGTLLDVDEGHDPSNIGADHPMVGEHHLYSYASWLLEWSVQAASEG
jgi:hypothetical protein